MTDQAIYQKVFEFASHAHDKRALKPENRFRKGTGIPYITHPVAVKDIAINRANDYYPDGSVHIFLISLVALLHDVLEDTDVSPAELASTLQGWLTKDQTYDVTHAIGLLTKPLENFNIIEYLLRIRTDTYALVVKLSDLDHNMSDLKPSNLLDKYKLCHYFLTQ